MEIPSNNRPTKREARAAELEILKRNCSEKLEHAWHQAQAILSADDVNDALKRYAQQEPLSNVLKMYDGERIVEWLWTHGRGKNQVSEPRTIAYALQRLTEPRKQYHFHLTVTKLAVKAASPSVNIYLHNASEEGGVALRSQIDEEVVKKFLMANGLTHCRSGALQSGRQVEAAERVDLRHVPGSMSGVDVGQSLASLIHAIQDEGADPLPCLVYMLALDKHLNEDREFVYTSVERLKIDEVYSAIMEHYYQARGRQRSRLPVLFLYAAYQCLVGATPRYSGKRLLGLRAHYANDTTVTIDGNTVKIIGDIQIVNEDWTPFEGVEVKGEEEPITVALIEKSDLPKKFGGYHIDRYYILSAADPYIADDERGPVRELVDGIQRQTHCEVIVNGAKRTLSYYLRLVDQPESFLQKYSKLVEEDAWVSKEHRNLWRDLYEMKFAQPAERPGGAESPRPPPPNAFIRARKEIMRPKLLSGKNAVLMLIALGIFSALAVWYRNGMPLPGRAIPSTAGKLAFISTRSGKPDVWLMDSADGKNPIALTQDDATDSSPAFSLDGSEVAFVSSGRVGVTPQIFRMDALPGAKVLQVTNTSSTKYSPQYGPNDMLYYEDAGKLLGTNLKDNDTDALLPEADQRQAMASYLSLGGFDQIKVSPDGSRYLAVMKVENHQMLTLYVPSDQALILLGVAEKIFIDWKPDGGFAAVFAGGAPSKPIPLLTPDMLQKGIPLPNLETFLPPTDDTYLAIFDKDVNMVGDPQQAPLAPDAFALSPDGTKAAFVFGEGKKMKGVVLVPIGTGGEIKPLYGQPSDAPAWSPDSQQIAFVSGKDIFVVPASGGEAKNLTNGQGENTEPVWSPAKPKK